MPVLVLLFEELLLGPVEAQGGVRRVVIEPYLQFRGVVEAFGGGHVHADIVGAVLCITYIPVVLGSLQCRGLHVGDPYAPYLGISIDCSLVPDQKAVVIRIVGRVGDVSTRAETVGVGALGGSACIIFVVEICEVVSISPV